jgi:hypothetical protein
VAEVAVACVPAQGAAEVAGAGQGSAGSRRPAWRRETLRQTHTPRQSRARRNNQVSRATDFALRRTKRHLLTAYSNSPQRHLSGGAPGDSSTNCSSLKKGMAQSAPCSQLTGRIYLRRVRGLECNLATRPRCPATPRWQRVERLGHSREHVQPLFEGTFASLHTAVRRLNHSQCGTFPA